MTITGPIVKENVNTWAYSAYRYTYRQTGPASKRVPLPHQSRKSWKWNIYPNSQADGMAYCHNFVNTVLSLDATPGYSRAHRKAFQALGDTASLGVSLAEVGESVRMMRTRLQQFTDLVVGIRRADFTRVSKALRVNAQVRDTYRRTKGQPFSKAYIEWLFGWKPLINDISDVIDILGRDFAVSRVRERATEHSYYYSKAVTGGYEQAKNRTRIEIGFDAHVSNPNLLLFQQLGLTNLAATAWDLVPFSFLVNVFVPINAYLSSFDAGLGWRLENVYVSRLRTSEGDRYSFTWRPWHTGAKSFNFERFTFAGVPSPSFQAWPPRLPKFQSTLDGMKRAASTAALLHAVMKL